MRRFAAGLAVIPFLFLAVGCSDSGADTITTPPNPTIQTDTYSGTLTPFGGRSFNFTINTVTGGSITATLTSLTAATDPVMPVGFSLGTWNGTACQTVLSNDAAVQNTQVLGETSANGDFCVRIYDAQGNLAGPQDFTIEVSRPQ